jgi:glycosyltransferase involved in cell wall biosynthesis
LNNFTLSDCIAYGHKPWTPWSSVIANRQSPKLVLATACDTYPRTKRLARRLGAKLGYFVQGPEILFRAPERALTSYLEFQRCEMSICGSNYLARYVEELGGRVAKVVPVGPDELVFYPRKGVERNPKSLAIAISPSPCKSASLSLQFAAMAKAKGFQVFIVGQTGKKIAHLQRLGTCLGELSQDEMAKLFSKVDYFVDFSVFEGLGLLPLEAAFCGAIPIYSQRGGADEFFRDGENAIVVPGPSHYSEAFRKLCALADGPAEKREAIRSAAKRLRSQLSKSEAFRAFEAFLSDDLKVTPATFPSLDDYAIPESETYDLEALRKEKVRDRLVGIVPYVYQTVGHLGPRRIVRYARKHGITHAARVFLERLRYD